MKKGFKPQQLKTRSTRHTVDEFAWGSFRTIFIITDLNKLTKKLFGRKKQQLTLIIVLKMVKCVLFDDHPCARSNFSHIEGEIKTVTG